MHTFVIAEIGSAWRFGSCPSVQMLDAVSIAKECGADAIKFQYCSNPRKMEKRRNVPSGSYDILEWPILWIPPVAEAAYELGIELMCTVFLQEDVETLNHYVKRWKVASLERNNSELIRAMEDTGKPIIISCGASDAKRGPHANLHCTVSYPAPIDQLNLSVIEKYGYEGYSDHSCNVLTGSIAVACGAKIIEVHVRHNRTPKVNPDYGHSLTMKQFGQYVSAIRMTERMLGDGIKKIMPCEEWALQHKVKS